jgi:hypothetical protein
VQFRGAILVKGFKVILPLHAFKTGFGGAKELKSLIL